MKNIIVSVIVLSSFSGLCEICNGWHFRRSGEEWQKVNIPHDDAIRHDFNLKKIRAAGRFHITGKRSTKKP